MLVGYPPFCSDDPKMACRKAHPWFRGVQWDGLYEMEAAYKPTVNGELDTQNFEKFSEVDGLPSTVPTVGPRWTMLTSKDANFIGFTFKKSDVLKSPGIDARTNASSKPPSLVLLFEKLDIDETIAEEELKQEC